MFHFETVAFFYWTNVHADWCKLIQATVAMCVVIAAIVFCVCAALCVILSVIRISVVCWRQLWSVALKQRAWSRLQSPLVWCVTVLYG